MTHVLCDVLCVEHIDLDEQMTDGNLESRNGISVLGCLQSIGVSMLYRLVAWWDKEIILKDKTLQGTN